MSSEIILEAKDICKSFSGVPVLKNVHFDVRKGEVHALMGENGAGKSTLIKILTGAYTKDSGTIEWKGKPVEINCLGDCQKLGMSCVYQELSVIPSLTVAQNVYLGREPRRFGVIDHKKMNAMTHELIERYNFPLHETDRVAELGIGVRQMVEILKGLSCNAELLIMDEPTASLSGKEAETLFSIIEALRERGVSIIYISHRLEEVYRLSDRLTVLRDGKNEAVLEHDEIDPKKVIQYMIGKVVDESAGSVKAMRKPTGEVLLHVDGLSGGGFHDIHFDLHKGEILGFGGLIGAGRTELVRAIYGIDAFSGGCITYDGEKFCSNPKASIRAGIGFVPEDRRGQGFIPLLSTTRNVALTNYDIIRKKGAAIDRHDELDMAKRAIVKMDIRPSDPAKPVGLMSGGNQQKVVLGKWLMRDLKLLIVDEPTAGIDVGAKDEIYNILEDLAKSGVAVILVTSDLQELIRVSHRILVMRKGSIVKEFDSGNVTQSDVLEAASGLVEKEDSAS
jgi:ribose transport system ATP-binding protein